MADTAAPRPRPGRPPLAADVARTHQVRVLLTADELARLDEARGDTPRAEYVRRYGAPTPGDGRAVLAAHLRELGQILDRADNTIAEAQAALDRVST